MSPDDKCEVTPHVLGTDLPDAPPEPQTPATPTPLLTDDDRKGKLSLQAVVRAAMSDHADHFDVQPALFAWSIKCRHCGFDIIVAGPELSAADLHLLAEHRQKHADALTRHDRCTAPLTHDCPHRLPRLPDEFAP